MRGLVMKKVSVFDYYSFGFNYNSISLRPEKNSKDGLVRRLKEFLEFLENLDLRVTLGIANDLYDCIDQINNLKSAEGIRTELQTKIKECFKKLDPALDSELKMKELYFVTPKKYSIDKLTTNIESLFSRNVFSNLPSLARYDYQEAGKCIAFNLPTASAFHLLRANEGYLRFYYKEKIKRNRIKTNLWGHLTEHLKTRKKIPSKLLQLLDHIRKDYRNPTQHPLAKYSMDEAQDLLPLSINVCNQMFSDLKK